MTELIVFGGIAALLAVLWVFYRPRPGQRRRAPAIPPPKPPKPVPEGLAAEIAAALRAQIGAAGEVPPAARDGWSVGYVAGWVERVLKDYGQPWDSAATEAVAATVFTALFGTEAEALLALKRRLEAEEDEAVVIGEHVGHVEAAGWRRGKAVGEWRGYLAG
jgi:hypothetical protein